MLRMDDIDPTLALTCADLAQRAGLSRSLVHELVRRGTIVGRKVGTRTIILRADALAWLEGLPRTAKEKKNER